MHLHVVLHQASYHTLTSAEAYEKSSQLWKESIGLRKPGNTYVSLTAMI